MLLLISRSVDSAVIPLNPLLGKTHRLIKAEFTMLLKSSPLLEFLSNTESSNISVFIDSTTLFLFWLKNAFLITMLSPFVESLLY